MVKKKLSPMIGKYSGAWSSGIWAGPSDPASSPRTPLDFNIQSPSPIPSLKGLKNHQPGGVGLGIVVEMEQSGDLTSLNNVAFGQSIIHPNPLPVLEETVVDGLENFTFVSCHGSNKSTKVYCDESRRWFDGRKNLGAATFYIDSPRFEDFTQYPPPDFLNSCHLCRKKLHGKNIYMYRGETGFCSNECRYKQIMMDEGKKKY